MCERVSNLFKLIACNLQVKNTRNTGKGVNVRRKEERLEGNNTAVLSSTRKMRANAGIQQGKIQIDRNKLVRMRKR